MRLGRKGHEAGFSGSRGKRRAKGEPVSRLASRAGLARKSIHTYASACTSKTCSHTSLSTARAPTPSTGACTCDWRPRMPLSFPRFLADAAMLPQEQVLNGALRLTTLVSHRWVGQSCTRWARATLPAKRPGCSQARGGAFRRARAAAQAVTHSCRNTHQLSKVGAFGGLSRPSRVPGLR